MTYDIRSGTILASVLALILNLIVYFIGRNLLSIPFTVAQFPGVVTIVPIILATVVSVIAAGILLAILQRATANFVRIFLWIAGVFALLSLIAPYITAIGRPTFFLLSLMHVITAMAVVYGILYFSQCDNCEAQTE